MSPLLLLTLNLAQAIEPTPDDDAQNIVNGTELGECGWPTVLYSGGCTAALVHPKAIATAQHCGEPRSVSFGETANNPGHSVGVAGCVGTGSDDAMLCELEEEVTELPVTPVLFGCELDAALQEGTPVVIAGFGQTRYGVGGGEKLWADQVITRVESGRVIVGNAGDGTSPCPGDSGGPLLIQVSDGSWRVAATVLGGTTSTPCNSAANYQRLDPVVANFEAERSLDITPCFDGATGDWSPGPECAGFFAGDETGYGTWDDWCEGTPAAGYSAECGEAYVTEPAEDTAPDTGTIGSDKDGAGCGCAGAPGRPADGGLAGLLLFGLTALRRRPEPPRQR